MKENFNFLRRFVPLWSEIYSIVNSIVGRAFLIISFASFLTYFYFIPDDLLSNIKLMTVGSVLVILSNFLFMALVPSVQRHYLKYVDYEKKCLKLEKEDSLDLYEEFGCIIGINIDISIWSRSGLSFSYLSDYQKMPDIDEYKENFSKGNGENIINRKTLSRSLSAIKYVFYDSSNLISRGIISFFLFLGIFLIFLPVVIKITGLLI